MLYSSLDALLKVSKTASPQKLFDYDCVTLYVFSNAAIFDTENGALHCRGTCSLLHYHKKHFKTVSHSKKCPTSLIFRKLKKTLAYFCGYRVDPPPPR